MPLPPSGQAVWHEPTRPKHSLNSDEGPHPEVGPLIDNNGLGAPLRRRYTALSGRHVFGFGKLDTGTLVGVGFLGDLLS